MSKLVTYSTFDEDQDATVQGSGYIIGDRYILTAGHVFFELRRPAGSTIEIRKSAEASHDYRGYEAAYIAQAQAAIAEGGLPTKNEDIEGAIGAQRDTVLYNPGTQYLFDLSIWGHNTYLLQDRVTELLLCLLIWCLLI